jgi:hypothetical protein
VTLLLPLAPAKSNVAVLDKLGVSSRQQAAERAQTAASDIGMPAARA